MTENRWDKIGKLFEETREMPPDERVAFLEEACGDPSVRKEVLSLLESEEEARDFFEGLASAMPTASGDEFGEERGVLQELRISDPLDLEGTTVGRYSVEEHLGGGGMGVVYKARDPELDRPVALKFLPPHLATSDEAERRFVREARAASALDHPHIATIYEVGKSEEGLRFIAMAFYEGETLKEKLARKERLPVEEAVRYAEQIATALARAHDTGIVHRDVKPANVMVTKNGDVKLLDFGLAMAAADTRLTKPGQQLGTAAYMSPEQAEGEQVGPATDLWALGIVLYKMLTGTRPFQGVRNTAILRAILHDDPTPLHEQRDDVPPVLIRIVDRCLQKNPDDRYSSAEVLLEDLRILRSESAPAPESTPQEERRLRRSGEESTPDLLVRTQQFINEIRWGRGRLLTSNVVSLTLLIVGVVGLGWVVWETWLGPAPGRLLPSGRGGESGLQEIAQTEGAGEQVPDLDPTKIAVLYFEDNSPGDTLTAFVDGFTEHLIHRLTQVEGLEVVSRRGVEPYREASPQMDSTAQSLQAGSLISGSVRPVADSLVVLVRLIDGETQEHLMSEIVRRPVQEVFALKKDLAREVSLLLRKHLGREVQLASWQAETQSAEAWRLVERADRLRKHAKHFDRKDQSGTALELIAQADSLLAKAGTIDPKWSAPPALRARLATVQVDPYAPSWGEKERDIVRRRIGYANEALQRDPSDTQARTIRGQLRFWLSRRVDDPNRTRKLVDQAERDLRRAIREASGSALAMSTLSRLLLESRGDFEQAQHYAKRAREADAYLRIPSDTHYRLFYTALNAGNFEDAVRWCHTGQQQYPDLVQFQNCELALLATEDAMEPDVDRAWELVKAIRTRTGPEKQAFYEAVSRAKVAAVLARAGHPDSARAVLQQSRNYTIETNPDLPYQQAHAYLLLGQEERALELLSRAVKRNPQYAAGAANDPWFRSLRDHAGFKKLVDH